MGNRAVITFDTKEDSPAIYLHWNGGRDSVEAFLSVASDLGINGKESHTMAMDSIAEMAAKHFFKCEVGDTVYREPYGKTDTDNYDNGVYIIDDNLMIKSRLYLRFDEMAEYSREKYLSIKSDILESVIEEKKLVLASIDGN